jgi:hypothetical protein
MEWGCLRPLALVLAVAIGVGVMLASRPAPAVPPSQVLMRVIDDGASPGPKVIGTAIVPLR